MLPLTPLPEPSIKNSALVIPELLVLMKKIQKYMLDYNELPNTIKYQKQFNITNEKIYPVHSSIEINRNQIKKNVEKPKFFIWSNDLSNLSGYFNQDECIFIDNKLNKSVNLNLIILRIRFLKTSKSM